MLHLVHGAMCELGILKWHILQCRLYDGAY